MTRHVYIGFDARQEDPYRVAVSSLRQHSSVACEVHKLDMRELFDKRILWRPVYKDAEGRLFDHLSAANQATEFAVSRFVVPHVHKSGTCLFVDCDVVFMADVEELFQLADPRYAVMCVKHANGHTEGLKMDGQIQSVYARKNWSSVVLWNCDHPAHQRLSLAQVNQWPGELLHQFRWLRDSEIGELPAEWNVLINLQPLPPKPKLLHFTMGGPFFPGWKPQPYDDLWNAALERANAG